jgi:FkbM family methyltransferase
MWRPPRALALHIESHPIPSIQQLSGTALRDAILTSLMNATGYNRAHFGYDVFSDIQHLNRIWKMSVKCFFDIGANDGATSALALTYFPGTHIFAFEPHPLIFERLKQKMQGRPSFNAFNLALGSEIGEAILMDYDSSTIGSLVRNARYAVRFERKVTKEIRVQCIILDQFCLEKKIDNIDVLKIDTEGFDYEVLKGANKLLSAGKIRFIYCEFNDIMPRKGAFGGALEPIAKLIDAYGYRFVASYNDYIAADGEMFGVSNALFVLPPRP